VGYYAIATIVVEFANTGNVAMPSPVLEVSGRQNDRRAAILTLDSSRLVEGFWTSAMPVGFSNSVQFLAHGNTPGLLQPGESGKVNVYYAGWQQPWDFSYPPIHWDLSVLKADNTSAIDWGVFKDFMRPTSLSDEVWTPVFSNLIAQTGSTWGDYVLMLNHNARYLATLGQTVNDIRDLLSFAVTQAQGLSLTSTLTSAMDAQVQAPGLPLTFTRSFGADIPSRYALGRLGRGWSDNWDRTLSVATDGTVTILGPNGSRRVFQPDRRDSSSYFSGIGDTGTLKPLGGGAFSLTEGGGTVYAFRSDGKLDYVQETHGSRVTCVWSGNQLTKLAHSAGPYLDLAYSGSRLASVTDSLGRKTTLSYDAGGEHLQSATDYRGRTTAYGYSADNGAVLKHALTSILYPDGTEGSYAYDAYGRLL
jgi:YD repeat-containing protein